MGTRKISLWAAGCLCMVFTVPAPASADAIFVSDGFLLLTGGFGRMELAGERGFALSSIVTASGGNTPTLCSSTADCVPGVEVSIFASWSGNDLTGDLSFEGQTYEDLGGLNSRTQATVAFIGSFIAPPIADAGVVQTPFVLDGRFGIPLPGGSHVLGGAGTATVQLLRNNFSGGNSWRLASINYELSPVPEPATMFLVGLGLTGIVRLARSRTVP